MWRANCELGKGFDLLKGCTPYFTDDMMDVKTTVMNKTKSMGMKIQSSADYSRSVSNAESLSFGGWGASASESTNYLTSSEYSSNSIIFQIGSIITQDRSLVRDVRSIKLRDSARTLLSTNPTKFIQLYGHNFVVGYQTTSSFFGSCSVHSSFRKSMDKLAVTFDMGY